MKSGYINPSLINKPDTLSLPYHEKMVIYRSYLNTSSFQFYMQRDDNPILMKVERNNKFLKKS